jgi:hypothetical protein
MSNCAVCKSESSLYLCEDHIGYLRDSLGEFPWLLDQLDVTITRQDRINTGAIGKSNDIPNPYNVGASRLASEVTILLARWVTNLVVDQGLRFMPPRTVGSQFVGPLLPFWRRLGAGYSGSPTQHARWLHHHVRVLAGREDVGDFFKAVIGLVGDPDRPSIPGRLVAAINKRTRIFAGMCPRVFGYGDEGEELTCEATIYALDGATEATCSRAGCGEVVNVAQNRMRAKMSRDLMPETQLLETLHNIGEDLPRVRFYDWKSQGRIHVLGYLHDGQIVPQKVRHKDAQVFSLNQVRHLIWQADIEAKAS